MKRLIVGVTAPQSVILIEGQLKYFKDLGYETYLMVPSDNKVVEFCLREGCQHLPVKLERGISLFKDILSLYMIVKILVKIKPDIVNFGTTKIGMLGILAAKLAGVKRRVYTSRGLRYEHECGIKRKILILTDRCAAFCAQTIICVSNSLRECAIADKVYPTHKCIVINQGSSNGVNSERFNPSNIDKLELENLKKKLNLCEKFIFGFVGRIADSKGVSELYEAFTTIFQKNNNFRLLMLGRNDINYLSDPSLIGKLQNHPGIIMVGPQSDVPKYMAMMDILVLPTWREGFPNVLIQAASMGVPVISTLATGSVDAVKNNYNGLLIPVKNALVLHETMEYLYKNSQKRIEMGLNGKKWARNFDSKAIWNKLDELYKKTI